MSKTLIVNNTPYEYPTAGDEPGWGSDATNWAEAVTEVLSDLLGPNDLLETAFNVANNQLVASPVTGLVLNAASVRAAEISYSIYRQTSTNSLVESGKINVAYNNASPNPNKWEINQGNIVGDAGVIFTIDNAGQIQYTSTNVSGSLYTGTMKFRLKSLQQ
jgi:hypothetical protein